MKCSVYIATSVDGFIAKKDGSVDWLHSAGSPSAYMGVQADMGLAYTIAPGACMAKWAELMEMSASAIRNHEEGPFGVTP